MVFLEAAHRKTVAQSRFFDSAAFFMADDAPGWRSAKGRRLIEKHESALQDLGSVLCLPALFGFSSQPWELLEKLLESNYWRIIGVQLLEKLLESDLNSCFLNESKTTS